MKKVIITIMACLTVMLADTACSTKVRGTHINGWQTAKTEIVSYNELTMDLDSEPIQYTIDISTEAGRAKLKNLSLDEAKELALVEAIMASKCATIFQPQYKHTVKNGKVLGVMIYGFPARYKKQ